MALISKDRSVSVAKAESQFLLVLCILRSSDCDGVVTSIPGKEPLWAVGQGDSTISSQSPGKLVLSQLTCFSQDSSIGDLKKTSDSSDVLVRVLKKSPVIKWFLYPAYSWLDKDTKACLMEYVIWRDQNLADYSEIYLNLVDIFSLAGLLFRYVIDKADIIFAALRNLK